MRWRFLGLLDRMLLRELFVLFVATLGGTAFLYLVIDYADRSGMIGRHAASAAAAEFYANKAAVIVYQVAPGALIIAAAMLVSRLSRTGQLGALFATGVRPLRLLAPVALFAAVVGALVFALGEGVVISADARMDEIVFTKFGDWGDRLKYHPQSTWLRSSAGKRFFKLGLLVNGGFEPVVVLEIAPPFRLERRLDARRMEPAGEGAWRLLDATETRFAPQPAPGGTIERRDSAERIERFPERMAELALRAGRPRQMAWGELRRQALLREREGQPVLEWRLAIAERATQAAVAVPGTLAGFLLALYSVGERRKQTLSAIIALALCLTSVLWTASTIGHASAMSGLMPPQLAGSLVGMVATLMAGALLILVRA